MAVLFGPSPVTLRVNSNPNTSAALQLADDLVGVRATLSHWNGTATARIAVEMSFDSGITWQEFRASQSTSPSGFKNRVDLVVELNPAWRRCGFVFPADSRYRPGEVCGENFQPGFGLNAQVTIHSDYAHQDTTPLTSLNQITFHNPDLFPVMTGPLRQLRATMIVSGNVSSQLLVESVG